MHELQDKRTQALALLDVAYAERVSNLKHSLSLAEQALQIARDINDQGLIGRSLNQLSLFYMILGEYAQSMTLAEEALGYFEALGDERGIADARYNIAGTYYKTDNYHLGLVNLINCLAIYRKLNDYHNQSRALKSLGTIYEYFGDARNAEISYEGAISAAIQAGDANLESNAYNPLSGIYLDQGKVDEAFDIIERSRTMKERTGDIRGLAFALYGRGKVFVRKKEFDRAEADFLRALEIHFDMGERLGAGMAYHKLGALYLETGRLDQAKEALFQGVSFSEEYNIVITKFKCNYLLYQVLKLEKDPVQALRYLESYLEQKEAVINTQTLQVIKNYAEIAKMEAIESEARLQLEKAEIIKKKDLAEQSARVKQEFLSTMSHEIRTPLNAVITITSLLKERSNDEEQELLSSLKYASNSLLLIINDILDFTKLDTGKVQLQYRSTNLRQLLESVRGTYESMATAKDVKLELNVDDSLAETYELDETKLVQILGNLVSNAIKYTDQGTVRLEVAHVASAEGEDEISFRVVDTGTGIPEDYFDEIFDSFSQPRSITTRKQGGSGLGLAIVKRLVELYKSEISFQSKVNEGSVFFFNLRLKPTGEVKGVTMKNAPKLEELTVLLAEDNMINAMVARKLLSKWGVTTDHAKNGLEAVEKAAARSYDLILMDIHMPEMNGFDATRTIRTSENPNQSTPIFALTADITAEQQEEYVSYFNGFLLKPIEISKLHEALTTFGQGILQ